MGKTLILVFHPDLLRSRANAALACAAADIPDVQVKDMYSLYPRGFDLEDDSRREAARLLSADRIVLQFPVYWYSTPPLMKAWQDVVLTRMFYEQYEAEGRQLEGVPVKIAATAGNTPEAYAPGGRNLFKMTDLFSPLRATAHRCGLIWTDPFVVYRADKLSAADLDAAGADYASALRSWIGTCEKQAA